IIAKDRAYCGPLNSDNNYIPTNDGTAERGTNNNPIVIKEDSEQEGSKTNPIVINDDADALDKEERSVQNNFTRDTEPLIYGQISDYTYSPKPESIHNDHLEEERPQVAKSNNNKETPPNKDKSCGLIAETNTSCGQPNFSWSSQGEELEPSPETSQADSGNPLRPQRSGKRKREHEGENNYGNRRSNRLANRGKQDRNSSFLSF
ncbi:hypothetical protein N7501_012230, partial [Penicillium viridicatum]